MNRVVLNRGLDLTRAPALLRGKLSALDWVALTGGAMKENRHSIASPGIWMESLDDGARLEGCRGRLPRHNETDADHRPSTILGRGARGADTHGLAGGDSAVALG